MREPACLQIPLLAVKTGQPRGDGKAWSLYDYLLDLAFLGYVAKKKSSLCWGLYFVWRSGRDSNSRPHAWQACILTKLNYRTVCILDCERTLFVSQMRVQKYDFFSNLQIKKMFFRKIISLWFENQFIINEFFFLLPLFLLLKMSPFVVGNSHFSPQIASV